MMLRCDVAVIGSGPAGLALATSCAQLGLDVVCIAPHPWRAWTPNYGLWAHQASLVDADAIATRYEAPRVWLDDDAGLTLPTAYLKLSTFRLHRSMLASADHAGVRFVEAEVTALEHEDAGTRVVTSAGLTVRTTLVVDASGSGTGRLTRVGEPMDAHQTAYGVLAEVDGHPYAEGEMSFMDFRHAPGGHAGVAPSFLYALPVDANHVFFEETALVQAPAMPLAVLEARLGERLAAMGIRVLGIHEVERCSIAMGLALPSKNQRTVAFGAAASMVHPATGYQLASALERAPQVAQAIADGLEAGDPVTAAKLAWEAIWPSDRVRLWSLYRFGMAALCGFDLERTRLFFDAFFGLEARDRQRYLDATASPAELATIMARLFWGAPLATQWRLVRHGIGSGRGELWRATTLGGMA
jgi:lycopene beta-cyclase